jgi:peptidoglycan-N-acetylglucosamine deacetylase
MILNMNLLGIDFEDWYHPELIQRFLTNEKCEPKVINGFEKILELLRKTDTFATFFVVGELVEFKPEIVDKIIQNGHEIGFHTMHHTRLDSPGFKENFDMEIKKFSELTNGHSKGFRAPTFSLNKKSSWAVDMLADNGYIYDSSIMPAKSSMYGHPNAEKTPYKISSSSIEQNDPNGKIMEFPLLVTKFLGKKIPAAGGFYLRFLPLKIIKNAITNYEKKEIPSTFYVHSWELTPEYMPDLPLSKKDHFITYHNIKNTFSRMEDILHNFEFTSFQNYLNNPKQN